MTDLRALRYLIVCLFALTATVVAAQQTDTQNSIAIELNTATGDETSCTLTFVVTNGHAVEIEQLVFEAVLFDVGGSVDRLSLFDFGKLPVGRPRVRQFAMQQIACTDVGRILFNGLHTCKAEGLEKGVCEQGLSLSTRSEIEVLG